MLSARLFLVVPVLLAACAAPAPPAHDNTVQGAAPSVEEWGQSGFDRVATIAMRENLEALYRLADKLYRRNPSEWRKGGATSREAALERLRQVIEKGGSWPALQQQHDIEALALALSPKYTDDRVAGFIFALADMLIAAHGGKIELYLLDDYDAQHLHNAARNLESAIWMLAQRRDAQGKPLLLADEISPEVRNVSYEREFAKIIARLDLLAQLATEKHRRAIIGTVQSMAGGALFQFLPVR